MATFAELMLRLRPAGAPGAASAAAVPSDRRKGVEHELEPVFAALADVAAQAAQIRLDAQTRATQTISAGEARARAMLAQAAQDASAERAERAAQLRALAQAEAARLMSQAEVTAAAVRAEAAELLPERVEKILGRVREQLTEVARE